MVSVRLKLAYDGTAYLGWQKTKMGPSIQEEVEKALSLFLQEEVSLDGISRTDAGVHSRGQIAYFSTKKEDLSRLHKSLNSMLPKDIAVWEVVIGSKPSAATSKIYEYYICNRDVQLPQHRLYSWHIRHPLDIEKMRQAARLIIGEKDFSSFCNVKENEEYDDYNRNLMRLELEELQDFRLKIILEGDRFLYKMARNIVGTLSYVGMGKILVENIPKILTSKDRTQSGITAPAQGLFLERIRGLSE